MTLLKAIITTCLLSSLHAARLKRKTRTTCGERGAGLKRNGTGIQIVNGVPANECSWKWQAGLRYIGQSTTFCGGMLINDEWVLSAAHCASSPNFEVVLGEYSTAEVSGKEQVREAVQVIRHPAYASSPTRNDFVLIRLASAVDFTECVGSVCLPTQGADIPDGSKCWITGWGTLKAGGSAPTVLQEAEVDIISNADCTGKFGYTDYQIDDSMLCAQGVLPDGSITDACQGDSGGPLVCEDGGRWAVYGATSWGRGCAGENYPGVWARVHYALDWIDETLEANQGPPPEPLLCPEWSNSIYPDRDGDCKCPGYDKCSLDGVTANCPTSGYAGGYGGYYFSPTCGACKCYSNLR